MLPQSLRNRKMQRAVSVPFPPSGFRGQLEPPSDFYNYFQHGLDFLITGDTHKVKKIVLHTNIVSITMS